MTAFVFVVLALASFRVTRLVVLDTLLDRPRDWIRFKFPLQGDQWETKPKRGKPRYVNMTESKWVCTRSTFLGKLLSCTYCSGVWVSAGVYGLYQLGNRYVWGGLVVASLAGGQALLSALDGRL